MPEILQKKIPYDVSEHKKLPGMLPLAADGWLIEDEAYAAQLAERDRLLQDTQTRYLPRSEPPLRQNRRFG
jgi:putative heme iron utilization protein